MNGCSLTEAYQGMESATREARKEERRRAKRCKGPAATFLGVGGDAQDAGILSAPSRQHLQPPPEIPAMNPDTGLRQHVPVDAPEGSMEPFTDIVPPNIADFLPRTDDDPAGNKMRNTLPSAASIRVEDEKMDKPSGFFGADPHSEGQEPFSDFQPNAKNYLLEPSFTAAFTPTAAPPGVQAGAGATLPIPSVRDRWKPLTPAGVHTAFFDRLPAPGGEYPPPLDNSSLSRKIDRMMARLDDLHHGAGSPEQMQTEILLFVSTGLFVLFFMDLLVRRVR